MGRYVLEEVLGAGGMGTVYKAFDPLLKRHVALKLLRPDPSQGLGTTAEWSARMLREARAAAAFTHRNVVAVYDVGTDDGAPYIAMELASGQSLRKFVGDEAISLPRRIRWLVDMARALAAAHRAGIVHRDVKPENVLVTADGDVKILDFGIAKQSSEGGEARAASPLPTLTAAGMVLGTPQYMAPEQIRGEKLSGRTDQFAWGVVAFEVLTGRALWSRSTEPMRVIASILTSVTPPAHVVAPALPRPSPPWCNERSPSAGRTVFPTWMRSPMRLKRPRERRRSSAPRPPRSKPKRRDPRARLARQATAVALAALAAGASAVGVVFLVRSHAQAATPAPAGMAPAVRRGLTVLLFANQTGRPEDDWLELGLADALQAKLSTAGGFDVLPRAPSAGGAGADADAARARGASLGIVGSFQKMGDQIRIAARAETTGEPHRILASSEERGSMAQIFDLQDALALTLAEKLHEGSPTPLPEGSARSAIRAIGTRSLEAFEALTTGRALLAAGRAPEAMRAFDRAVAADPAYRDARATLNRVRAESHHFLVKEDGAVVETISPPRKGDPNVPLELTTDSGTLTRAWDLDGNALAVERITANGNQATFRVTVPPEEARAAVPAPGIVYEIESSSKDKRADGLGVFFHSVAKSTSGESTFIVELPRGRAVAEIPTPVERREDESGTFLLVHETRGAFVPYAFAVVHASDDATLNRFRADSPVERAKWIEAADPRMQRHGWSTALARTADVARTCDFARRGDHEDATATAARIESAVDLYGPFFVLRSQFCIADAARDDRAAVAALEAMVTAPDRPPQLAPEAYLDAVAWYVDRKRIGDAAHLLRLEHRDAPWFLDKPFHLGLGRGSAGDDERALRRILAREPGNVAAAYDLALTLYEDKRYEEAALALHDADEFLGGVYVAELRARIAIARGQGDDAASELRKLATYYPMTTAWTAHAVLLASAGRADDAFAVVVAEAPKTEYDPPVFWALRYVVGVLPHASRYAARIVDIVAKAKETQYGQPYRLDRMVDLIEVASLSVDPEGGVLARTLFDTLKAMLRSASPEACDEECLRKLGAHLCRVRGRNADERAWIATTLGGKCE